MRTFLNLIGARNKEFYRDRSSMVWAICFPILLIIGFAFAFSSPDKTVFSLGYNTTLPDQLELPSYIDTINYDDAELASQRIRHHQLDMWLDTTATDTAYYNPSSATSTALRDILSAQLDGSNIIPLPGKAVRYVEWVIPGILGMNIMFGALFGVGYVIVRYRKNGVLKRLAATPVTAIEFLAAQVASRFIIVILTNTSILVGSVIALDIEVQGSWLSLIACLATGCITMICIGLIISSRTTNEELAGGLLNLITWPMMLLSELWFTLDKAPQWMQAIANILPLTHMVRAARQIMVDGAGFGDVWPSFAILIAVAVICLLAAATLFRWEQAS